MREQRPQASHVADELPASDAIVRAIGRTAGEEATSRMPYHDTIQAAFGGHDLSGLRAAVGGGAGAAAEAIGADAYALGNRAVFRDAPSLHTAAHEAAHYVQARHGGGVGHASHADEHHADAVADAVESGRSAEGLLGPVGGSGGGGDVLQRTMIGGWDSANPHQAAGLRQYLTDPARTYQELQTIRGALLRDKDAGWQEWLQFVDHVIEEWQVDDVASKQDSKNWGTASLHVDDKLAYVMPQPVHSGMGETSFSLHPGLMQTPDVEVSHKDSEVIVLQRIKGVLAQALMNGGPPSEVVVKLVSTNGACNGCKGRLAAFANEAIDYVRQLGWGYNFRLTIQYRYLRPPKDTKRYLGGRNNRNATEVPTTYGHFGDMETSLLSGGTTFQHDDIYEYDPVTEGKLVEMDDADTEMGEEDAMDVEVATADYLVDQLTSLLQGFRL